jgi:hypothetical protein
VQSLRVWLLVLGVLALVAKPGPAQRVRVAFVATEANNQHKLFVHRDTIYLTYTRPVVGVPQVHVGASRDGQRWRTLGQVSRGSGPSTLSTLVVDGADHAHVTWTQFDGPIGRVYYSRSDGRWSEPVALSPPTAYAGYPSMDIDSRGRLHLVWYGIREASAGQSVAHGAIYEVFYARHDRRWTQPVRISLGTPDAINPALAVDAQDHVHAVWFQSDGRTYQVVYTTRPAGSGTWTPPVTLTGGEDPSTKPALAVDRDGRVHVVWERKGGVDYVAGTTGQWSTPVHLSDDGVHPVIGLWSRGIFVLWHGVDGSVWMRVFDGQWGDARRLSPGDYPNAAPWRPGDVGTPVAVWTTVGGFQVTGLAQILERR